MMRISRSTLIALIVFTDGFALGGVFMVNLSLGAYALAAPRHEGEELGRGQIVID